jgi:hypothetical protein
LRGIFKDEGLTKDNITFIVKKCQQHEKLQYNKSLNFRAKATSKYKGVVFRGHKYKLRPWMAWVQKNGDIKGKMVRIGNYETEIEAAIARDEKCKELYGAKNYLSNREMYPDDFI